MKFLATDGAPRAIGPYSQAVIEGNLLFASGQIPLDPSSGELVGGSIERSAERIFDNLESVLRDTFTPTLWYDIAPFFKAFIGLDLDPISAQKIGYLEANLAYALKRPDLRDAVRALCARMAVR